MRGLDTVHRLSLLLVLIGLTTLYTASFIAVPDETDIGSIDEQDIGSTVRITGSISALGSSDSTEFFRIDGETGSIRAVRFDGGEQLSEGEQYMFEGRIDMYEGDLELIVESVMDEKSSATTLGK